MSLKNTPTLCLFNCHCCEKQKCLLFVQHLNNLLENYLEPLKKETFLSNAEINALFGNIQEIVAFQRQFLQNLDESLELEPDFHKFEHPSQFKVSILSIIDYQDHVFFPLNIFTSDTKRMKLGLNIFWYVALCHWASGS